MKPNCSSIVLIKLFLFQYLFLLSYASQNYDFFYFVQQWPASYCDTKRSCCYPKTGKPAEDFSIHGLWPEFSDGTYPSDCDETNSFDRSQISDLRRRMEENWPSLACPSSDGIRFWTHEWEKHGTCSESVLDQHGYFKAALDFKDRANLLQVLNNAGIRPGKFYSFNSIKDAIKEGVGYEPEIECNVDPSGNRQLYQVYLCVDSTASEFRDCPGKSRGRPCGSEIEFPSSTSSAELHEVL